MIYSSRYWKWGDSHWWGSFGWWRMRRAVGCHWRAPACLEQPCQVSNPWEGRDQVFETWPVPFLSCPPLLTLFPLLALSSVKSSQPKPSHSVYCFWKGFYFWSEWLVMQRQVREQGECPTTGSLVHGGVQKKHPSTTAVPLPFVTLKFH